jgi:hypothetical protein
MASDEEKLMKNLDDMSAGAGALPVEEKEGPCRPQSRAYHAGEERA